MGSFLATNYFLGGPAGVFPSSARGGATSGSGCTASSALAAGGGATAGTESGTVSCPTGGGFGTAGAVISSCSTALLSLIHI